MSIIKLIKKVYKSFKTIRFASVREVECYLKIPIDEEKIKKHCKEKKYSTIIQFDKDGRKELKYPELAWKEVFKINIKKQ